VGRSRPLNILVTAAPVLSHLWDVTPIAWALRSRGHDVRVATLPNLTDDVVSTGLTALPAGPAVDIVDVRTEAAEGGQSGGFAVFARVNARVSGLLARALFDMTGFFRPDLVVHEPADLAGPLVAQRLGVPCVHQSCGPPMRQGAVQALRGAAAGLRREIGLDEDAAGPALIVDVCPPSFQVSRYPIDGPRQPMRYVPYNGPGAVPGWLLEPADRPRVCVTLGTVLPGAGGLPLLHRIVHALDGCGMEVIVPLRAEDAQRVDVAGADVRVVGWFPLRYLEGRCDLVVHHGGPGTTLTLLGLGIPQAVVPTINDQHTNARLLEKCGAGIRVDADTAAEADIRAGAVSLLEDPGYRRAAGSLAAEIAAMPSPLEVAARLGDLVPMQASI
jgi:UDP:flavonoid glycosyltransferase YjiC (YdhE family)